MNTFAQQRMRKVLGMLKELKERTMDSPLNWCASPQMGSHRYYGTGEFDSKPVATYEICRFEDSIGYRWFACVRNSEMGAEPVQLTDSENPPRDVAAAQKICDEHWLRALQELKNREAGE